MAETNDLEKIGRQCVEILYLKEPKCVGKA